MGNTKNTLISRKATQTNDITKKRKQVVIKLQKGIVLVINDDFFCIYFLQLQFKKHYKRYQLNIPFTEILIGVVNHYSGKTIFFAKNDDVKINECSF